MHPWCDWPDQVCGPGEHGGRPLGVGRRAASALGQTASVVPGVWNRGLPDPALLPSRALPLPFTWGPVHPPPGSDFSSGLEPWSVSAGRAAKALSLLTGAQPERLPMTLFRGKAVPAGPLTPVPAAPGPRLRPVPPACFSWARSTCRPSCSPSQSLLGLLSSRPPVTARTELRPGPKGLLPDW